MILDELRKRSKYINEQKHPTLPLILWNYNQFCQFDNAWDEYTLMARGLITDLEGNIVSRPFPKFFNLGEKLTIEQLPMEKPVITEKLDGSLGIQYYDGDKICIATRGSFNSEQAKWATEWMNKKGLKKDHFSDNVTYLYEIIYPENRIVVDYGDRKELVMLAIIDNKTGLTYDPSYKAKELNIRCPKKITNSIPILSERLKTMSADSEGFVVYYPYSNLRVKMKGDEYCRLHRLITGFSTTSIWECLKDGQNLDELLERVPDEFYQWVKEKKSELEKKFAEIIIKTNTAFEIAITLPTRKDQAIYLMKQWKDISGVVFSMLDNKPYESIIWKMIKPKWELPFKQDS